MFLPVEIIGNGYPIPTLPPISRFYNTMHGVLGVYITNKCNIRCAHCCTDSSPDSQTLLNVMELQDSIKESFIYSNIKAIHVSGGEPFLKLRLLQLLGQQVQSLGLSYAINTNAFWAHSISQASNVINGIPGLSQLIISSDEYHEVFQSSKQVAWAAKAGVEAGIHVQICFCTDRGGETEFVQNTLDLLPKAIRQRVSVAVTPVELGGRANSLPEAHWRPMTNKFPEGPCPLVARPVVLEDGTVQACCNTTMRDKLIGTPLQFGKISDASLIGMLSTGSQDPLIRALRYLGPAYLAKQLSTEQQLSLSSPMPDGDICTLCTRIVSKPKMVEDLRKNMTTGCESHILNLAETLFKNKIFI